MASSHRLQTQRLELHRVDLARGDLAQHQGRQPGPLDETVGPGELFGRMDQPAAHPERVDVGQAGGMQVVALADTAGWGPGDGLAEQVFLSGRITDMQSRLNVRNLVVNGELQATEFRAFERLYQALGLPPAELSQWTAALVAAQQTPSKPLAPLMPQRLEQMSWLGVSPRSLARLAPHITVLPSTSAVNLNTASAAVLHASVANLNLTQAQTWVRERNQKPFDSLEELRSRMGSSATGVSDTRHSVSSRYFEVVGQLRQPQATLLERSLVVRDSSEVKTIWREHRPLKGEPGCLSTIDPPC